MELKKLRAEKSPNDYIKTVAVKMFPNEEAYNLRLENYRKRHLDNDLYASIEELYELYYHIAKEENRERLDDEIEQMSEQWQSEVSHLTYLAHRHKLD
jgi:hypothetical protein